MKNSNLKELLYKAQTGDIESTEKIIKMFKPLIYKNSFINGKFDDDCYQELNIKLLNCIKSFRFQPEESLLKYFNKTIIQQKYISMDSERL